MTKQKDWRLLEFFVPIEERVFDESNDEFIIRGTAINETTTLNNVKYIAEELEQAAPSFRNVPILLDHKNEVKNIVGRTTANVNFNSAGRKIDFEGKIMDKAIREMIKDGRIQNVSIGAKVKDLLEEKDGSKKAVGIQGLELSIVAVPGDCNAGLAHALQDNFILKEMANIDDKTEVEEIHSSSEQVSKLNEKREEKMTESVKEEIKTENVEIAEIKKNVEEFKKDVDGLKELIVSSFKEMKEKQEVIKAEEKLDKTKGEVVEAKQEIVEAPRDYVIESAGNGKGFSMYGDYSKNPNLKRLSR